MTRRERIEGVRWALMTLGLGILAAQGCAAKRGGVEPLVVPNPVLGAATIAVAPAVNLSGSTDFDPDRFADLMAGELMHAERVSVVPVSRVLAVLSVQGTDRVKSPRHASEIAALVGADAILVFAVTEYDPYDPPSVSISAQLFAANPRPAYGAPLTDHGDDTVRRDGRESSAGRLVAESQRRFDASHADVVQEIREFARQRNGDDSPFGWRRYVVSQQHFIQYCCYSTIRRLLNSQGWPVAVGDARN